MQISQMQTCARTPSSDCNARCDCILLPQLPDGWAPLCVSKSLLHKQVTVESPEEQYTFAITFTVRGLFSLLQPQLMLAARPWVRNDGCLVERQPDRQACSGSSCQNMALFAQLLLHPHPLAFTILMQASQLGVCCKHKTARKCNAQCGCSFTGAWQCLPKELITGSTFNSSWDPLVAMLGWWGDGSYVEPGISTNSSVLLQERAEGAVSCVASRGPRAAAVARPVAQGVGEPWHAQPSRHGAPRTECQVQRKPIRSTQCAQWIRLITAPLQPCTLRLQCLWGGATTTRRA